MKTARILDGATSEWSIKHVDEIRDGDIFIEDTPAGAKVFLAISNPRLQLDCVRLKLASLDVVRLRDALRQCGRGGDFQSILCGTYRDTGEGVSLVKTYEGADIERDLKEGKE